MQKTASRITLDGRKPGTYVTVGLDHATGWFFQLWDKDDDDYPIIDKDSFSDRLSQGGLLELLEKHAKRDHKTKKVMEAVALDLDPGRFVRASQEKSMNLRNKLIRLAHEKPELRPHLLPILKEASRPINEIAQEIAADWGHKVNYAAKPYLEAMFSLRDINDDYLYDTGASVVAYFLANANSWRGDTARRVKKELKDMLKRAKSW